MSVQIIDDDTLQSCVDEIKRYFDTVHLERLSKLNLKMFNQDEILKRTLNSLVNIGYEKGQAAKVAEIKRALWMDDT
jgi:hypothetical protein